MSLATLSLVLRFAVFVQCVGLLWTSWVSGSAVETVLFGTFGWHDQASFLFDRVVAASLLVAATIGLLTKVRLPYVLMAAWFFTIGIARWFYGGAAFSALTVPAHAVRWAAPLAISLLPSAALPYSALRVHRPGRGEHTSSDVAIAWLLRSALALTFLVHGLEALQLHPRFIDYILMADRRLLGGTLGLQQSNAEMALYVIGAVDVGCALWLIAGRMRRGLLLYMAFWGVLTACSRVVHSGEHGIHETLIRAANGGVALALWFASRDLSARAVGPLRDVAAHLLRAPRLIGTLRFAQTGLTSAATVSLTVGVLLSACTPYDSLEPTQLRLVWDEAPAHHIRVSWTTWAAGATHTVYYDTVPRDGDPASYAFSLTAERSGRYDGQMTPHYHHAELHGLTPSTKYWFVVESDDQLSEEYYFETAPTDDRAFKLLYGGDSRSNRAERRGMNGRIAALVEDDPHILALTHGGDYVDDGGDWDEWDEWLSDHARTFTEDGRILPILPIRGNHEGDAGFYNRVFGFPGGDEVDYFVSHVGANLALIILDSNVSHGGDQRTWLEQQLVAQQERRWIVPSYHLPAYPAVKTPGPALEHWVPLFEQYDVDLVCEADGHALKRTVPIRDGKQATDGIVYVGEGGLGVGQRTPGNKWYLEGGGMAASAHHVQLLSFSSDALRYEAIGMDGEVLDSYVAAPRRAGFEVPNPASGFDPDQPIAP